MEVTTEQRKLIEKINRAANVISRNSRYGAFGNHIPVNMDFAALYPAVMAPRTARNSDFKNGILWKKA